MVPVSMMVELPWGSPMGATVVQRAKGWWSADWMSISTEPSGRKAKLDGLWIATCGWPRLGESRSGVATGSAATTATTAAVHRHHLELHAERPLGGAVDARHAPGRRRQRQHAAPLPAGRRLEARWLRRLCAWRAAGRRRPVGEGEAVENDVQAIRAADRDALRQAEHPHREDGVEQGAEQRRAGEHGRERERDAHLAGELELQGGLVQHCVSQAAEGGLVPHKDAAAECDRLPPAVPERKRRLGTERR
mmetsp:Transcript_45661/g.152310  ORF Transcript_45661/g.152310 Transcript_45661/m.152310 type:complete len:249 (-) Transcript_45661:532-1278(-)